MVNIDQMPAGRELDALVAEKVMGIDHSCLDRHHMLCGLPSYSTDIAAAWNVWLKLMNGQPERFIERLCWFVPNEPRASQLENVLRRLSPERICRAALKAAVMQEF